MNPNNSLPVGLLKHDLPVSQVLSSWPPALILVNAASWSRRAFHVATLPPQVFAQIEPYVVRLKGNIVELDKLGLAPRVPCPDWSNPITIRAALSTLYDVASELFSQFQDGEDELSVNRRRLAVRLHRNIKPITVALFQTRYQDPAK